MLDDIKVQCFIDSYDFNLILNSPIRNLIQTNKPTVNYSAGKGYRKTNCPACKNRSLSVNLLLKPRSRFLCWEPTCNIKGDIIDYFRLLGIDFIPAITYMCEYTGKDVKELEKI